MAVATGYANSAVSSATYAIQTTAAAPTFTPGAGTYTSAQTVTLSSATPSSTIYYTTDGRTPTTTSSSVTSGGTVSVGSSETLNAIAVASGYNNSAVSSAAYVIEVPAATPTFSPGAGNYTSSQTVTLSSTTTNATIYYTTDGSTPTTSSSSMASGGTITVNTSETLNAIAVAAGYNNSASASATYVIQITTLKIISGNNQIGSPGAFTDQPLVVQVATSSGTALPNTPVTFTANSSGQVSSLRQGPSSSSLQVQSDANGLAEVYCEQTNANSITTQVVAATGGQSISFSETTSAGDGTFDAPTNVVASSTIPGEVDLTWINHASTATGILIEQSTDDVTWTTVATLTNPTATSYSIMGLTLGQNYCFRVSGTK